MDPVGLPDTVSRELPPQDTGRIFLIDKPAGPTSFAMVRGLRRVLGLKKVGHAGTLDPFASGLLILCAGRSATRLIPRFMDGDKEYLATLCLGVETTTLDPEGEVTNRCEVGRRDAAEIERVLARYRGSMLQTPPAYSALKYMGKPLYHYARRGITIVKEPREVKISVLERTDGDQDIVGDECLLHLRVVCSKGTYIRSLAADIGSSLGCGAYLKELRRTRSGCFSLDGSLSGDVLRSGNDCQQVLNAAMSVEEACNLLQ